MGQVEFKDFLWEATLDTALEDLDGRHRREPRGALRHRPRRGRPLLLRAEPARGVAAWEAGWFGDEVSAVVQRDLGARRLQAARHPSRRPRQRVRSRRPRAPHAARDPAEAQAGLGGVQTGGNSSAIVDGAAAVLVARGDWVRAHGLQPLARVVAGAAAAVPSRSWASARRRRSVPRPGWPGSRSKTSVASRSTRPSARSTSPASVSRARPRQGQRMAARSPSAIRSVRFGRAPHPHRGARRRRAAGLQYGVASACAGGGQGVAVIVENYA